MRVGRVPVLLFQGRVQGPTAQVCQLGLRFGEAFIARCVELLGLPEYGTAEVRTDFDGEAQLAVDHFWDRGLRHFAYFSCGNAWWIQRCLEAYRRLQQGRVQLYVLYIALTLLVLIVWKLR